MRVGFVPVVDGSHGGIYQYSATMLSTLREWQRDGCRHEFVMFADEAGEAKASSALRDDGWDVKPLKRPTPRRRAINGLRQFVGEGPHRDAWRSLRSMMPRPTPWQPGRDLDAVQSRPQLNQWLTSCGIDVMMYPVPTPLSFEAGVPYIMAIHDLQHRLQPEFPEVSANGEWEAREYRFRNGARSATLLLADSEVGKQDILESYGGCGVTSDKVKVLPYLPACYLGADVPGSERQRIRAAHRLPERYIFYPAQFWPHKNHRRIVEALGVLKQDRGLEVPVVFCGSHSEELRERTLADVMSTAGRLGVDTQIHYLGYVPDEDMSAIYAEAVALVMPTFFGPTNIPILEAWAFGCPVLTSDIRGIREQVHDAGVLVDPRSVDAIAEGIFRLWADEALVSALVKRGRCRLATYTPADFQRRLIDIIEEASVRVRA